MRRGRQATCAGIILEGDFFILEKWALPYNPGSMRYVRFMLPKWHFPFRKECFAQDGSLVGTGMNRTFPVATVYCRGSKLDIVFGGETMGRFLSVGEQ